MYQLACYQLCSVPCLGSLQLTNNCDRQFCLNFLLEEHFPLVLKLGHRFLKPATRAEEICLIPPSNDTTRHVKIRSLYPYFGHARQHFQENELHFQFDKQPSHRYDIPPDRDQLPASISRVLGVKTDMRINEDPAVQPSTT